MHGPQILPQRKHRWLKFSFQCLFLLPLYLLCFSLEQVAAAPLGSFRAGDLEISLLKSGAGKYLLEARSKSPTSRQTLRPEVLVLENPSRLVIDFPGVSSKSGQNLTIRDPEVSGMRVGVHPDKLRIVIDLSGAEQPIYKLEPEVASAEKSIVYFSFDGSLPAKEDIVEAEATPAKLKPTPIQTPTPTPIPTATPRPSPTPKVEPTVSKVLPTPAQTPAAKESASPQGKDSFNHDELFDREDQLRGESEKGNSAIGTEPITSPVPQKTADEASKIGSDKNLLIRTIYYQTMNNTQVPAVAFDIEGLNPSSSYRINQIKPDIYELVIQNAKLSGQHLTLPQFPPDSFRGFSVLVAREEGNNVIVKVYVEEDTKLLPFTDKKAGQLWLRVSK